MSILNKMHKELKNGADDAPVLSVIPENKGKHKVLVLSLIGLLLVSSMGLSYLIYHQQSPEEIAAEVTVIEQQAVMQDAEKQIVATPAPISTPVVAKKEVVVASKVIPQTIVPPKPAVKVKPSPAPKAKVNIKPVNSTAQKLVANDSPPKEAKIAEQKKEPHLAITKSTLTDNELANIHLKKAQQALKKGDNLLAAKEKSQALNIKPDLHEVRKGLALYYYGVGQETQATRLLKRGAKQFPEHADFNLMLSRIALKNNEQQRAYLYLNQNPPSVEGNLDYHASYAILAQKFKNYEQAETLYQGLLMHRPNNGRWLMSLAIVQDKQNKESAAVKSYQQALLQVDLSSKAKAYINQRLTYLANQQGTP